MSFFEQRFSYHRYTWTHLALYFHGKNTEKRNQKIDSMHIVLVYWHARVIPFKKFLRKA